MTTFVNSLRTGGREMDLTRGATGEIVTLRVQLHEVWDTMAFRIGLDEPVRALKVNALQALDPSARSQDDYFIKIGGNLVFNEGETLRQAGAKEGSTFFIHRRRRRAVR